MEYTKPDAESSDKNLLASASRDRLIHVFNVDEVRFDSFYLIVAIPSLSK